MSLTTLLLIILILLLVGMVPVWPYSLHFGYGPSGVVILVLIIVLAVLATRGGRL